ncbi:HTH domain-containing protein [Agarivorans sp. B2Z047]|uniref:helix-turn-helix domain-containing protein n=1 Tax=Agarivorans sp. B2Z047 TaxID=2652721 RepID=UPI00128E9063|nr:helix-turn-helix domain-containing protein [Agarivorans sp. B2Z047]MPW31917.1 HTH domain-containing protein [Agarivorans sp. B2Z047]UQN44859.1 helix-turn-helix domain-containing protein [Agarivorans sp. B2Z047]
MSMILTAKALGIKVGSPLRKFVLIKLADNANDKGECFPSYQHISDQCEIERRTVIRHVKKLEEDGFLRIERRKGPKGNRSNVFHLTLDGPSDRKSPPSDLIAPPGDTGSPPLSDPVSPITCHSFEPVNEQDNYAPKNSLDFSDWEVPNDLIVDWKKHRKQKRAAVTQRVINMHSKEFKKANALGISTYQAVEYQINRGWTGYEAEWHIKSLGLNGESGGLNMDDTTWAESFVR